MHAGKNKPVMPDGPGAPSAAKYLKKTGMLQNLDESDEINACTVQDHRGRWTATDEPWLLLFKNETHNHPTEIEPFGGAATCIGGAIRDPLSGRGYVYQAMRVTGAGDPLVPVSGHHARQAAPAQAGDHRRRRAIPPTATRSALPPVMVDELYHPGYVAKRMEIGAVVGAAPGGKRAP